MPDSAFGSPPPIPDAPWHLRGEAVAMLAAPFTLRLLVRYTQSPVGPYDEHALATLTKRGPHVFQMSVNLETSRIGGRTIWGFPKTLESLAWVSNGSRITFRRQSQRFHIRPFGPTFPLSLPFWTAQQKGDEWVRVPGHIKARARLAWRGPQLALALEAFDMEIKQPQ
ncbi:hypothetical protein EON83_14845 [bacterium]|nr:MAG: hypothetical protein EON83_14845 [bacterium]